jgi:hypothetical protein
LVARGIGSALLRLHGAYTKYFALDGGLDRKGENELEQQKAGSSPALRARSE